MEKKKFDFKKFSLVLCICFVTLFAFIPFANFSNISSVSAETINTSVDFYEDNLLKSSSSGELTSIVGKKWFGDDFTITNSYFGSPIWTDGDNVYYSLSNYQYILDKATSTWNTMTWNGYSNISGSYVWTDGDNVYYSNSSNQYVLDKATSTWNTKTWNGYSNITGSYIWTDGDNVYYSYNSNQYVLDKATSTWNTITWNSSSNINGSYIWTDGDNVYYSYSSNQYILDKATSTWNTKTWNGSYTSFTGSYIWTDGDNIYYSQGINQYILDKATSTWNTKIWNGYYTSFDGSYVWTDGVNYYYFSTVCSIQFTTYTEYELGLSNGYEQGYNEGLNEDYHSGYTNGYNQGKQDGLEDGYQNGYTDGEQKGNTDGYANGKTDGLNEGYTNGKTDGLNEGYTNGYNQGKNDGFTEAENNYYSYGPFTYSTISYYSASSSGIDVNNPLSDLYSGYFTSYECVEAYNGGFYLYDPDVESCMIDNDDLQVGLRVVFDTPISCLRYSHLVPLRLGFGNIITLSFTDGTKTSFNMADGYYDYIDLSDYSSKYILSLDVIILRLDFLDIGLAFSNDYVHIYDLAYRDGRDYGYSTGYSEGATIGYNNGYINGLNDSNQYTFYNLFGAVLDAPVKVFSSLFNFNFLGVNLLGLITGLFTLAMILLVIKLILGGK